MVQYVTTSYINQSINQSNIVTFCACSLPSPLPPVNPHVTKLAPLLIACGAAAAITRISTRSPATGAASLLASRILHQHPVLRVSSPAVSYSDYVAGVVARWPLGANAAPLATQRVLARLMAVWDIVVQANSRALQLLHRMLLLPPAPHPPLSRVTACFEAANYFLVRKRIRSSEAALLAVRLAHATHRRFSTARKHHRLAHVILDTVLGGHRRKMQVGRCGPFVLRVRLASFVMTICFRCDVNACIAYCAVLQQPAFHLALSSR